MRPENVNQPEPPATNQRRPITLSAPDGSALGDQLWPLLNARRGELLDRSDLSDWERKELQGLQVLADAQVEWFAAQGGFDD